jgi:hypothetical protein
LTFLFKGFLAFEWWPRMAPPHAYFGATVDPIMRLIAGV